MAKRLSCFMLPLCTLALGGSLVLLFLTRWGIGVAPDSATYISVARSVAEGRGFSLTFGDGTVMPLVHFPPLFPALLAAGGFFGIEPWHVARWLNALLFAANIMLVGLAIRRCTAGASFAALLGAFLALASYDMLKVHTMVWTEPLFLFLGLSGLLLLALHIDDPNPLFLLGSAAAVALAFLTRFAGASLVLSGTVAILLFRRTAYWGRLRECAVFGTVSSVPMGLWLIRNLRVSDRAVTGKLSFHPIALAEAARGLRTVSRWFLGGSVPTAVKLTFLLIMSAAVFWAMRRSKAGESNSDKPVRTTIPSVLAVFAVVYGAFLVGSISFVYANIRLDYRILAPVHVCALILLVCTGQALFRPPRRSTAGFIVLLVASLCLVGRHVGRAVEWASDQDDAREYAARPWRESVIISELRRLPDDVPVFSNAPGAVAFLAGRCAYGLPEKQSAFSGQANEDYLTQLEEMRQALEKDHGVLAHFNDIHRDGMPTEAELRERLDLRPIRTAADGAIYVIADSAVDHPDR